MPQRSKSSVFFTFLSRIKTIHTDDDLRTRVNNRNEIQDDVHIMLNLVVIKQFFYIVDIKIEAVHRTELLEVNSSVLF